MTTAALGTNLSEGARQASHSHISDIEITRLLSEWNRGDPRALPKIFALVSTDLQKIARRKMGSERPDHTLQPTALVNEAFLRLNRSQVRITDRIHFLRITARVMRSILVDYARKRRATKRCEYHVPLSEASGVQAPFRDPIWIMRFNLAIEKLAAAEPQAAAVVEMRFFSGMSHEEIARHENVSKKTIQRIWRRAKLFLARELDESSSSKK